MAFKPYEPNISNLKSYMEDEKSKQYDGNGPTWWSIPKGTSAIRILPPWDPTGRIALAVYMHPIEYQSSKMKFKKYNWTCLNKTFDKPCRICEGLKAMSAAGVDISKYEANRRQFYMNAIVVMDPRKDGVAPGTHVLMRAPKTFYDWVISQITNPMVGDITSITNGIDVYITKDGEGLNTSYTATLSPNGRAPIPQEYLSKIEDLYNLDGIFSSGFDEELISELINSLKSSAGVLSNSIPSTVNNMAGMPTQTQFRESPTTNSVPPSPYGNVHNEPPHTQQSPVSAPTTPPADVSEAPKAAEPGRPRCFGSYDPTNVTCVVCNYETPCSSSSN